jgi:hypothetical protein
LSFVDMEFPEGLCRGYGFSVTINLIPAQSHCGNDSMAGIVQRTFT